MEKRLEIGTVIECFDKKDAWEQGVLMMKAGYQIRFDLELGYWIEITGDYRAGGRR